jgi:hypothetical protein
VRSFLLAALAVGLSAAPIAAQSRPSRFSFEKLPYAIPSESAAIVVSKRTLEASGFFITGCGTEVVTASLGRADGSLTISIEAQVPEGVPCLMVTEFYRYSFEVVIDSPGRYESRVEHVGTQAGGVMLIDTISIG